MYIFSLDGEEVDFILVRSTERAQVPVKDDSAAIEANTDLTRRDTLVSNVEGDTLLEVAARFGNGDRAKDGDFDLSYDLDAKVGEVVVDHDLIDELALECCSSLQFRVLVDRYLRREGRSRHGRVGCCLR